MSYLPWALQELEPVLKDGRPTLKVKTNAMSEDVMPDNCDFTFLIQRLDTLHSEIMKRIDGVQAQVGTLTSIVTNGLSHRTTQTEHDVKEMKKLMATREELTKILTDCSDADKAWLMEQRARRRMWLSLIVGPIVGAIVTYFASLAA